MICVANARQKHPPDHARHLQPTWKQSDCTLPRFVYAAPLLECAELNRSRLFILAFLLAADVRRACQWATGPDRESQARKVAVHAPFGLVIRVLPDDGPTYGSRLRTLDESQVMGTTVAPYR